MNIQTEEVHPGCQNCAWWNDGPNVVLGEVGCKHPRYGSLAANCWCPHGFMAIWNERREE